MLDTVFNMDNNFQTLSRHRSSVKGVSYVPVVKSILIYAIGIAFLRAINIGYNFNGVVFSFLLATISSIPIMAYIWHQTQSTPIKIMLLSYWPIITLVFLLTSDMSAGSGDGEVFLQLTKRFSNDVLKQGNLWPGLDYFKSVSITYWFTIYFYSIPFYLFNDAYEAIFPFAGFIVVIISYLFFALAYQRSNDIRISLLTFITFLFYPGYWLHNLNVERDIIILLLLVVFSIVLSKISRKTWIIPLLSIIVLFIFMSGSRSEYIIVFILFIGAEILGRNTQATVKPIYLLVFIFVGIAIISSINVFTPSGTRSFSQIGLTNTLNIFEKIISFPARVFYSAVGAFPWTRSGIVDAVGHNKIHLVLHIISTVIRIIIIMAFTNGIYKSLQKTDKELEKYKLWMYQGGILMLTVQFSSIGYTRYIDPSIVFLIPLILHIIKRRVIIYAFCAIIVLLGAHYLYYISI
jgi:hypothetical protein